MKTVGCYNNNFSNGITYEDWKKSYSLYAYDLSGSGNKICIH